MDSFLSTLSYMQLVELIAEGMPEKTATRAIALATRLNGLVTRVLDSAPMALMKLQIQTGFKPIYVNRFTTYWIHKHTKMVFQVHAHQDSRCAEHGIVCSCWAW